MNPFASRLSNQSWVVPISGMCIVLGFMVSLAWVTKDNRTSRGAYVKPDQEARVFQSGIGFEAYEQSVAEVKKLQEEKTKLESALAKKDDNSSVLNESLQETKALAGLTEVEGPGVSVTLTDSRKEPAFGGNALADSENIIHDRDVLHVVNELFASGAEAIEVNGQRVMSTSSFRCVGTTILVNDVKIASPVVVRAIGDPNALFGAMNMPGGVFSEIRAYDDSMVQIEKVELMRLPAYVGTTELRFAKTLKLKETSSE